MQKLGTPEKWIKLEIRRRERRIPAGGSDERPGETLTADLERRLQLQQDRLAEEDLPGLAAQAFDLHLGQLDVLARSGASHWFAGGRRREERQR